MSFASSAVALASLGVGVASAALLTHALSAGGPADPRVVAICVAGFAALISTTAQQSSPRFFQMTRCLMWDVRFLLTALALRKNASLLCLVSAGHAFGRALSDGKIDVRIGRALVLMEAIWLYVVPLEIAAGPVCLATMSGVAAPLSDTSTGDNWSKIFAVLVALASVKAEPLVVLATTCALLLPLIGDASTSQAFDHKTVLRHRAFVPTLSVGLVQGGALSACVHAALFGFEELSPWLVALSAGLSPLLTFGAPSFNRKSSTSKSLFVCGACAAVVNACSLSEFARPIVILMLAPMTHAATEAAFADFRSEWIEIERRERMDALRSAASCGVVVLAGVASGLTNDLKAYVLICVCCAATGACLGAAWIASSTTDASFKVVDETGRLLVKVEA